MSESNCCSNGQHDKIATFPLLLGQCVPQGSVIYTDGAKRREGRGGRGRSKERKEKKVISKIPRSLADEALDSVIYDACRLIALAPHPKWPGLVGRSSVRRFTTSGYIVGEMEKGPALASFRNWGAWGSP